MQKRGLSRRQLISSASVAALAQCLPDVARAEQGQSGGSRPSAVHTISLPVVLRHHSASRLLSGGREDGPDGDRSAHAG